MMSDNIYYFPELDLYGTIGEMFTQARNGYIENPEALRKLEQIAALEKIPEDDRLVLRFLREEAEDDGHEGYNLGRVKKDVFDMGHSEELALKWGSSDITIGVRRTGFEHSGDAVVIGVTVSEVSSFDDCRKISRGGVEIPLAEFYAMTTDNFDTCIGEIICHNMGDGEPEDK